VLICICCRLGNSSATGCLHCACDAAGTAQSISGAACNKITGNCPCKSNVEGRTCNRCRVGNFNLSGLSEDGCQPCDCDVTGTVSAPGVAPQNIACDQNTGNCTCRSNRVSRRCDRCRGGTCYILFPLPRLFHVTHRTSRLRSLLHKVSERKDRLLFSSVLCTLCGSVVERRSLAGELSRSCARPVVHE